MSGLTRGLDNTLRLIIHRRQLTVPNHAYIHQFNAYDNKFEKTIYLLNEKDHFPLFVINRIICQLKYRRSKTTRMFLNLIVIY